MHRIGLMLMGLLFPLLFAGAYLAFDFWNVNRMSRYGEGDGVTFGEYVSGWVSMTSIAGGGSAKEGTAEMPADLVAMLPKAPEGWTVRPTAPEDFDAFLPAPTGKKKADKKLNEIRAILNTRDGNGVKQVRQTYENGARRVVFELVRYPDFVFTSFAATAMKMELQMSVARYSGRPFMTVRGMEISEDVLPEEFGLRYFIGDVSAQVWVRVLAPKSMTDMELLPFFQTLHVPAMNASAVEKVKGMGEVPVIVLASVIEAETRAAWEAERAAAAAEEERIRAEKEAARAAEEEAERQAEEDRAKGIERDEDTGIKLRKGTGEGTKKSEKTKAGFGDDGCTMEGARKVCGGLEE